jgi:hypothetical protein
MIKKHPVPATVLLLIHQQAMQSSPAAMTQLQQLMQQMEQLEQMQQDLNV